MLSDESSFVHLSRAEYEELLHAVDERNALLGDARREIEHLRQQLAEQLRLNWRDAGYPPELADRLMAGVAPVKALREARGMTVKGLSDASGVHRTRIIRLEQGVTNNTIVYLRKLATYFGVAVDDILNR